MTVYGDLDVTRSLDGFLPQGVNLSRRCTFFDNRRLQVFGFMRDQIDKKDVRYMVYPLVRSREDGL